jgi:hypothetical protein
VALVLLLAAHSRSEGSGRFLIGTDGRIDIAITLTTPDVPELCDADLAIVDPVRRTQAEQKVTICVEEGLPRWLRLRVGDERCPIAAGAWRRGDGWTLELTTQASCPPPAGRALTIDWGFFGGSSLEHIAAAIVVLPDGSERRTLLSRRNNRVVLEIPAPPWRRALPGAAVMLVSVAALALVGRAVRRRRAGSPHPPAA